MSNNQTELLLRLSQICDGIEKGSASPSQIQSIRELAPTISTQLCPADRREEWLDLQLMIQKRPQPSPKSSWLDKLRQLKLRLVAPALAWR